MDDLRRQIGEVQKGLEDRAQKDHDLLIELKVINQSIVTQVKELDSHTSRQIAALDVRLAAELAAFRIQVAADIQSLKTDVEGLKRTKYTMLGAASVLGLVGGLIMKFFGK